jgi:hypothetical protein
MPKAAKKSSGEKSKTGFKYEGKSLAQPQLIPVFEELKALLKLYENGALKAKEAPGQYHLWNRKEIEFAGRKRSDIYFAGLLIKKGYVGFYYMPVYANPLLQKELKPELLKCLKGKSCFHIKKLDDTLRAQINDALKIGYACYEKWGWV